MRLGFFSDITRVIIFFFFCRAKREFFSLVFNIKLYDKNCESDYFFFLHQNQNIFSAKLGIRIFFLEKKHNMAGVIISWLYTSLTHIPAPLVAPIVLI